MEVELHAFWTSTLEEGEWAVSRPSHFYIRGKNVGICWTEGWKGKEVDTGVLDVLPEVVTYSIGTRTRMNIDAESGHFGESQQNEEAGGRTWFMETVLLSATHFTFVNAHKLTI